MNRQSSSAFDREELDFDEDMIEQAQFADSEYDEFGDKRGLSSKRHKGRNNYLVRKKIEARQEARRLRELTDSGYDEDWN